MGVLRYSGPNDIKTPYLTTEIDLEFEYNWWVKMSLERLKQKETLKDA